MKIHLHFNCIRITHNLSILFLMFLTGELLAQPAEIPYHIESYILESGSYNGYGISGSDAEKMFSGIVGIRNIPWLSLHFESANLGNDSYVIVTSLKDDYWQKLNALTLAEWNYFSAFFNGDAVEVELFVAPSDENIFINVDEVVVGDWVGGFPLESQCGPTDDRIRSDQPATGRLMSGCTAWIIPNGDLISAGHCLTNPSPSAVMEFNVPRSLPSGTIQHPGPDDQYSVRLPSIVHVNGGIGNDWGVFQVSPNSNTGLTPMAAQGDYFTLVQGYGPDSIRITGYGVDTGEDNQTQQTHMGPNWGSSEFVMKYRTDTEGGNSGSPVIDGITGFALGVHTHGGCDATGGNNSGTSFRLPEFWDAVDQGLPIPVELTMFRAEVIKGGIELVWITATETNNMGFELERKEGESQWKRVDFIAGNGNSTEINNYRYLDKLNNLLNAGVLRYRLKQIDYDGSINYSHVIYVDGKLIPKAYSLEQNFPNPFNPSTIISFSIPKKSPVSLKIYDILGNEVITLVNEVKDAGRYDVKFDASKLASGTYIYQISTGDFISTKKFMLLK